jgi:hypothetical protein
VKQLVIQVLQSKEEVEQAGTMCDSMVQNAERVRALKGEYDEAWRTEQQQLRELDVGNRANLSQGEPLQVRLAELQKSVDRARLELQEVVEKARDIHGFVPEIAAYVPPAHPLHGTDAEGLLRVGPLNFKQRRMLVQPESKHKLWEVTDPATGLAFVVKEFRRCVSLHGRSSRRGLRRQVQVMEKLRNNSSVITAQAIFEDESSFYVQSRLWGGVSLVNVTAKFREGQGSLDDLRRIARELLFALSALHKDEIYCDLKPEHVVMSRQGQPVIVDFQRPVDTAAANICALGSIIHDMCTAWAEGNGQTVPTELEVMVACMMRSEPSPTAEELVVSPCLSLQLGIEQDRAEEARGLLRLHEMTRKHRLVLLPSLVC